MDLLQLNITDVSDSLLYIIDCLDYIHDRSDHVVLPQVNPYEEVSFLFLIWGGTCQC